MNRQSAIKWTVAMLAAAATSPAFAAISDSGLLDDVTNRFLVQSATWGTVITDYATWLFWTLATISMVWTFGLMALRKADIGEFFAEFIRFTVTTGFFWWLLANGPTMAMAIIESLRTVGAKAGNLPYELTPSSPMSIAFDVVKKAFKGLSWVNPIDNLGIVLISAAVVVAMAIVAANVLIALVTAWVMAYAGVFILGFGGGRWTSDMAIGYFKAMLGIGLELMTVTLLVAIALSVIDGFYQNLDESSVYELLLVLSVCVVLAFLVDKIPPRVAALGGGGSGAGMGAGTIMSGAAMAAAAVATGGAAIAAGAATVAGGAQALTAAFSKAMASESAGSSSAALVNYTGGGAENGAGGGSATSLAAAMGDAGAQTTASAGRAGFADTGATPHQEAPGADMLGQGATSTGRASTSSPQNNPMSSSSPKSSAGGISGLASAIPSKAGRVAARTVGNIAVGAWDVARAKASDIKEAAAERIADTTGGKMAAAIQARAANASSGAAPKFDGGSLSAGTEPMDAEAEIAAFRDRDHDKDDDA